MESARENERPRVGFVGLGAMGAPMAARLVDEGFRVRVWTRTRAAERAEPLVGRGATLAASPAACARGADVIVTMLSDAAALASVLEGPQGLLAGLAEVASSPSGASGASGASGGEARAVFVDMSTVGRRAALDAAARIEERGALFVDAPVSGSVGPAARGELVALAGGSAGALDRARPVLDALCKKVIHAGPCGAGQALKVVLNGLGAHHLVAFTSMLALGERAGLPRAVLVDAFTTGAFASPSYVGKRAKVLARDFAPEFSLSLTRKDCALNVELQDEVGLRLPVQRAVLEDVAAGIAEGLGDLDLFALERHYASIAGPERA
jgi:3-hydroxyisobutyrate dehydrogenase-like beta-hydroxyacid dehydrogenase